MQRSEEEGHVLDLDECAKEHVQWPKRSEQRWRASNEERSEIEMKYRKSDGCSEERNSKGMQVERIYQKKCLMEIGWPHVDQIKWLKETRRNMLKSKRNNLTEEVHKEAFDNDLQMRTVDRLDSTVKTEIHGAKNRAESLLYEEIGY